MFSLRSLDKITVFENIIFNFEKIYHSWIKSNEQEMNQKVLMVIINETLSKKNQ
jgi:hypothetical protein